MTIDNMRGIGWALVAAAMFAFTAALAKVAIEDYHVLQILFFRQLVVLISSLPAIAPTFPDSLKTPHIKAHAIRLSGAFVALSCSIWAVAVLPLTTATTLAFAQVFFVALLAMWFLNEPVGKVRITAIVIGFIGVVIVMRPGTEGLFNSYALIPLAGALGAAIAIVSVRRLSQVETTATLLTYQAIFVGLLAGLPLIWLWRTPDLMGLLLLLSMGVLAAVGQWVGIRALRLGEVSVIGNIEYTKLIYAAILGYVLFQEIPDIYTIAGAAIIVVSAIYIFHRETLHKKTN
ncbi:MAG: EamA family transporter [Rhizobiaceae bacterium]|nr:EamA family transporter [Rhizobiaceae bacterium]